MDDREIRDLVKVWNDRARKERDPVSKFVFLWFCFNATLAYESNKDTDRKMINWLKERRGQSLLVSEFVRAERSSYFRDCLNALLALSPITDPRGKKADLVIRDASDFGGIVEAVYQVRCNLFHGAKRANDQRDMKLVIICARILQKWVGNVVSAWP